MSVVLSKAANLSLKTEVRDKWTLYIDGRPCQAIKSKWFENCRDCRAMTIYMPRNGFADFLLYVPEGQDTAYVVPRGKIAHDTAWAESALEPYKEAWHLLKETSPLLFERKVESLSGQLQQIITEAKKRNLSYELVRSKRGAKRVDYRIYMQRRIVIGGKRCAVSSASFLPEESHPWPTVRFRAPFDRWADFFLFILNDDVYVMPRSKMPHATTVDMESSRIYDYKNACCVLEGVDPTSSERMAEYRKGMAIGKKGQ